MISNSNLPTQPQWVDNASTILQKRNWQQIGLKANDTIKSMLYFYSFMTSLMSILDLKIQSTSAGGESIRKRIKRGE